MEFRALVFLLALCCSLASQGIMASVEGPFEVILSSYNKGTEYIIMKYNRETGETWIRGNDGFESLPENQKIPESLYQITITDYNSGWLATRIDTRSGKTWTLRAGKWFELM